ncbi:hypothetical protein GGR52DRAFT_11583 [Hypoxylon sp. FL1284]|nr:hypothetical protein GGR52DRAFT_11583 [Hypoxylon sp. FL1284]
MECRLEDDGPCPSWVPDWSIQPGNVPGNGAITVQSASSQFLSWHDEPQPGVLRVMGVRISSVKQRHELFNSQLFRAKHVLAKVRRLLLVLEKDKQYKAESYGRILFGRPMGDDDDPLFHRRPNARASTDFLEHILSSHQFQDEDTQAGVHYQLLVTIFTVLRGAQVIQTTDGQLGVALDQARAGDEVYCVLGCCAPLLLRPLRDGTFRVVGPCIVDGVANGEAFLGPLPTNFRRMITATAFSDRTPVFRNTLTGETTYEDPRLRSLRLNPEDLDAFREYLAERPFRGIYVDPEIVRESGADLRCFDLV